MRVTSFRHAETIVFGITTVMLLVAAVWNANATAAAQNAAEEVKQIQQQQEIAANEEARMIQAAALKIDAAATPQAVDKQVKILKTEIQLALFEERTAPLAPIELKNLLKLVGFEGTALKQAWAIVIKESNGRPKAHNKNSNTGDNSYGLFQINMIGALGPARLEKYGLKSNEELFDPVVNARIAYQMSGGGNNFSAWKVYGYNSGGERYTEALAEFPSEKG
jgi:hypothetical protein